MDHPCKTSHDLFGRLDGTRVEIFPLKACGCVRGLEVQGGWHVGVSKTLVALSLGACSCTLAPSKFHSIEIKDLAFQQISAKRSI